MINRLAAAVGAPVLVPAQGDYETVRGLFNGRAAGRPAAIVRCRGANEVAATIRFARDERIEVRVRAGGHNPAGQCLDDDVLLIDLRDCDVVAVDPHKRTATVGGGALWKQVDTATLPHGLAAPGGDCCVVGVAGYTLGGGHGLLSRAYGLGCDSLVGAELVDAEGNILWIDDDSDADLLWALKGGGGNFGAVTKLELALHPVPEVLFAGARIWPVTGARDVMRAYRDIVGAGLPDGFTLCMNIAREPFPDGDPCLVVYGAFLGGETKGAAILAPLNTAAAPAMDVFSMMPYSVVQTLSEEDITERGHGLRGLWKGGFFEDDLSDDAIDAVLDAYARAPSPTCRAHFDFLGGGAVGRVDAAAMAFPHRNHTFGVQFLALWPDVDGDEANMAWARDAKAAVQPYLGGGVYSGYGDPDLDDWARAYYGGNLERLVDLKRRYDPDNVFRFRQGLSEIAG